MFKKLYHLLIFFVLLLKIGHGGLTLSFLFLALELSPGHAENTLVDLIVILLVLSTEIAR
jgi:hypothetical protein